MATTSDKPEPRAKDEPVVLMYPGNQLRKQVRPYEETQSTFKVVNDAFFKRD